MKLVKNKTHEVFFLIPVQCSKISLYRREIAWTSSRFRKISKKSYDLVFLGLATFRSVFIKAPVVCKPSCYWADKIVPIKRSSAFYREAVYIEHHLVYCRQHCTDLHTMRYQYFYRCFNFIFKPVNVIIVANECFTHEHFRESVLEFSFN